MITLHASHPLYNFQSCRDVFDKGNPHASRRHSPRQINCDLTHLLCFMTLQSCKHALSHLIIITMNASVSAFKYHVISKWTAINEAYFLIFFLKDTMWWGYNLDLPTKTYLFDSYYIAKMSAVPILLFWFFMGFVFFSDLVLAFPNILLTCTKISNRI